MTIWMTSDSHFNHEHIIEYSLRPFKNTKEMNECLIENWNSCVRRNDIIYHLGDFGLGDIESLRKIRYRLRGKIHIIWGNHDYKNNIDRKREWFSSCADLRTINWQKTKIILCHYQMTIWDSSHYDSWHLFGHTHTVSPTQGKSMNVGVDLNGYYPVAFEEIERIMKDKPHNINYKGNYEAKI